MQKNHCHQSTNYCLLKRPKILVPSTTITGYMHIHSDYLDRFSTRHVYCVNSKYKGFVYIAFLWIEMQIWFAWIHHKNILDIRVDKNICPKVASSRCVLSHRILSCIRCNAECLINQLSLQHTQKGLCLKLPITFNVRCAAE